jgi:hypothetical protein
MNTSNNINNINNINNTATARPGRPRALDEIKRAKIVTAVAAGFNIDRAARYVGCAASTIHRECRRNPQFCRELDLAIFTSELAPLNAIREAAKKDWRAGVWLLEHLNPELFGRRSPRQLTEEQAKAFTESLAHILAQEVSHPAERQRVCDKLLAVDKAIERMILLNANTPPRRRSRVRAREHNAATATLLAEVEQTVEKEAQRSITHQNANQ